MYKCVLFDMDGTLVNTYQGIFNAYRYAMKEMNLPFYGDRFVRDVIGAPLMSVFKDKLSLCDSDAFKAVNYYREYYALSGKDELCIYEGIEETLQNFKEENLLLGVATLKRESFAKQILDKLDLSKYFDSICGIDDDDSLTKTDLICKCLKYLKTDNKTAILVGDSEYDKKGAQEAGIAFMAVTYGFGYRKDNIIKDNNIKFTADTGYEIFSKINASFC